jgi:ferredoxin
MSNGEHSKLGRWTLFVAVLLWSALAGWAAERFPPPDFQPGYVMPVTHQVPPLAAWREWLDAGALVGLLAVATWLALKRRSRAGLFGVSLVAIAWFGFWRKGCVCPIGAIQNVALGLADARFAVPLTVVAILMVPLVMTALFGRTYCAAVCPHGALQDLVLLYPVRLPGWLASVLGLLPHVYLGLAVLFAATGSAFLICRFDPFIGIFRLSGPRDLLLLGALFLFASVFIGRPYCRFVCPLGALFGWLSRLSWRHVTITPDECIHCRLCEDVCPFDAIEKPVPETVVRDRRTGRLRLGLMLLLCPLLVAGGVWLGMRLSPVLARAHAQVRLAEALASTGVPSLEVTTFRNAGGKTDVALREAAGIRRSFRKGGGLLGAYLGLVAAGMLIRLSVRRPQPDYVADHAACFSCGRCFMCCPREWVRQGKLGQAGVQGTAPETR